MPADAGKRITPLTTKRANKDLFAPFGIEECPFDHSDPNTRRMRRTRRKRHSTEDIISKEDENFYELNYFVSKKVLIGK